MKKTVMLSWALALVPTSALAEDLGDYQTIIVGSGYGGSVAAYNLAKKGVHTLVLERGRFWTVTDPTVDEPFPTSAEVLNPNDGDPSTQNGDPRVGWLRTTCGGNLYTTFPPGPDNCDPTTGLLEVVGTVPTPDHSPALVAMGISALAPSGVGGGSLVNNGITYAPSKASWDVAFPPSELPYMQDVWNELAATYYPKAIAHLAPEPIPSDVLNSGYYAGTTHLYDFFGLIGYPQEDPANPAATENKNRTFPPVIVDWDAVRDEIDGKRVASAINGEVWWGINSGAKKSLDTPKGYLGKAIKTGLTEVRALHTVSEISFDEASGLYKVTAYKTDEDYNTLDVIEVTTRHLIMSAGSLGTTKLLVRARETGALPYLNEHVGTRFSSNGNVGGVTFVWPPEMVAISGPIPQGGPAGIKVHDHMQAGNPVTLENLPAPVPAFFQFVSQYAAFRGALSTIGIGIPQGLGSFSYDSDSDTVELEWPFAAGHNVYERVVSIYSQHPGYVPGGAPVLTEAQALGFTLHPLGGVPLGLATDMHCQLDGYAGLYAVDGSVLPGAAAAANPSATIAAMAERCMHKIAKDIADSLLQ